MTAETAAMAEAARKRLAATIRNYEQGEIMTRKNNSLTHAEIYRVTRWIDENKAHVATKSQDQIAKAVTAGTGLICTVSNIRGVAETLGINLGRGTSGQRPSIDVVRVLANGLCDLYARLGEPVPEAIKAMTRQS